MGRSYIREQRIECEVYKVETLQSYQLCFPEWNEMAIEHGDSENAEACFNQAI